MPTITETLMTLVQDLRDAVTTVRGVLAEMRAVKDSATGSVTTIINDYRDRPPVTTVFVDEINGDDANDGATIAKPRKSIDAVVAAMGVNSTSIVILSDVRFKNRNNLFASLNITGGQRANNPLGFVNFNRTIRFLGTAENSPQLDESFPSGLLIYGAVLRTINCNYDLPDVPSGQTYRAHFISLGSNFTISAPTITVGSAQAGSLIGVLVARATVYCNPVFGQGAAGHLFDGVTAGANPNTFWNYSSNLIAA